MRSGSVCHPVEAPLLLQVQTYHLNAWYVMCRLNVIENCHKTDIFFSPQGPIRPDLQLVAPSQNRLV